MAHNRSKSVPSHFKPGEKVRVKHGVRDPDFPDIPLGGWAGKVKEVKQAEGETTLLVVWDRATLRGMHPIYRKRCERDGLELESMWLGDEDLEPDDGRPVAIEQPKSIVTKPLSEKDQDDRVRMALGLTHDDPLADVTYETLLAYHRYLAANLKFPIYATCWEDSGPFSSKKVTATITGLADPQEGGIDEGYGLAGVGRTPNGEEIEIPLDEIEPGKKDSNHRLLDDYSYWFHNWR
jgi:Calcium binding